MSEQQDKKNKIVAFISTIGVHTVLLLCMLFVIAWKAPDPPLGELGVDLNIGLDLEGSGDIQPEEPIGTEQPKPEKTDEQPTQPEEKPQEVVEEKPVEKDDEEIITSKDEESPAVIKEKKKEEVKPKVEEKPVEKPKEKVEEKPLVVYKPSTTTSKPATTDKSDASGKEGKPGNQGDDVGKTGDKGDPRGTVDGKAMYGQPGNGGGGNGTGSSLDISGWEWDEKPSPRVSNNESGRVVFEIKVDDSGDVISIKTIERSVSADAEQICRKEIQKLTFTKIGVNVPPVSTGKITFVMRSR